MLAYGVYKRARSSAKRAFSETKRTNGALASMVYSVITGLSLPWPAFLKQK